MAEAERPNIFEPELEFDESDPEGYRAGMDRVGTRLGAGRTGISVYELPPGQANCPYHYELADEEWLVVVSGRPTLRTPEGEEELAPGAIAYFPTGPAGAHKIANRTDEAVRMVMFGENRWPAVTVYPDSDKIGVFGGADRTDNVMVHRSADVDYFDGEPGT